MHVRFYQISRVITSIILSCSKKEKTLLAVSIFLVAISSIITLCLPWLLKYSVDSLSLERDSWIVILILISYGIMWSFSRLIIDIREYIAYKPFEAIIRNLNIKVFDKLLSVTMYEYMNQATGRVTNSLERAQQAMLVILFGMSFVAIPMLLEVIIAACILGYVYGIEYSAILISIPMLYAFITWITIPCIISAQSNANETSRNLSAYTTDLLLNLEGVIYQTGQNIALNHYSSLASEKEKAHTKQFEKMSIVRIYQTLIISIGLTIMTIISGIGVLNKTLQLGDFILFNGYLLQFLVPLGMLGYIFKEMQEGFAKLEDAIVILLNTTFLEEETQLDIVPTNFTIRFVNASFTYPESSKAVFNQINFIIPENEIVIITGENGVGKSTVTKLIFRLYDLTGGDIFIGDTKIEQISLTTLRKIVGIVPQDTFLLNDTILSNIMFGQNKSPNDPYFCKIMSLVGIEKMLSCLPDGYQTQVGQRGFKLSGGQRQRISLARTLLKKPKILILDEALNSIDINARLEVLNYIKSIPNMTKIFITHNNQDISYSDKVLKFEKNKFSQAEVTLEM